jgi:hypothetical protein
MAKVIELPAPPICRIPLKWAIYCENCKTISNSRPQHCAICGREAVLPLEAILNRDPNPPGHSALPLHFSLLKAVGA